jgi:4-hydroxy-tetrahydrodipicolinate reductase
MGHMVEAALQRRGIELACASEDVCNVPDEVARESVVIDFTTPEAFRANYPTIARKFKAAVIGTTGWYDIKEEVFAAFEAAGTPMVWASNFSIGVNAFFAAVERACEVLKGQGYTPRVDEIHHIHKLDAPSGTAKSIGKIISDTLGVEPEIGAQRIGEVPGTHTATFLSGVDKLTFTHEAFSREGFAEGAVAAALLTDGLQGIHEFKDLIL